MDLLLLSLHLEGRKSEDLMNPRCRFLQCVAVGHFDHVVHSGGGTFTPHLVLQDCGHRALGIGPLLRDTTNDVDDVVVKIDVVGGARREDVSFDHEISITFPL